MRILSGVGPYTECQEMPVPNICISVFLLCYACTPLLPHMQAQGIMKQSVMSICGLLSVYQHKNYQIWRSLY